MFQPLLRYWLMRQAQEQVKQSLHRAAADAAKQSTSERPNNKTAGGERPTCEVGIVFALSLEAGSLVDRLQGVISTHGAGFVARQGTLGQRRIVVVESGVGSEAAARGTQALIDGHRPRWIISAGLAGGLTDALKANDLFIADRLGCPDGQALQLDFRSQHSSNPAASKVQIGKLLTVDRIVSKPEEKRQLAEAHGADAVDMETWGVAEVCQREKTPLLAVRIISDTVDRQLPRDLNHLVKQKSLAGRFGAVTGAVLRRPSSVKDMWQLREEALECSRRLAKFLEGIIAQLP